MTKKINPLKAIRVTLKAIGYTIIGLFFALSIGIFAWVGIKEAWPYWGAWAITVPFLFVIALILGSMLLAFIGFQFERFGYWYRSKETNWSNKHTKNN